jgi:predicted  nucleic acid-binding Zn-ribbon protein
MEKNQLEILLEDIQGKFDLVLEGHEALRKEILDARSESNEKHDLTAVQIKALSKKIDDETGNLSNKIDDETGRLSKKIDDETGKLYQKIDNETGRLSNKIDAISIDLAEHRADTERHGTDYKVSE